MSCAGCSIEVAGKPSGCRTHGSCSTGGCNRLNVHDWLSDVSDVNYSGASKIVEVSFKNGARKEFFHNTQNLLLDTHDAVVVEGKSGGYDIGTISTTGNLVKLQMKRKKMREDSVDIRKIIRKANDFDLKKWQEARLLEKETMIRARAIARTMNLQMKIGDVEYQGDGRKASFYYTAEDRVDFRELIKVFANDFHVKIDMHQIGLREEAGRIGGIGSCGRELCCSTWLTEFKNVNTAAARYQNLSINQQKLSGNCGRLKCCLNYELDTYMDALKDFPQNVERLETENGTVYLQKADIFKRLMWFQYKTSNTFYPLTVERVKEIQALNKEGKKPSDLGAIKIAPVKEVFEFVDAVGEISLKSLQNQSKKRKNKNKKAAQAQGEKPQQRAKPNQPNRPQQQNKPRGQNKPQQRRPPHQAPPKKDN